MHETTAPIGAVPEVALMTKAGHQSVPKLLYSRKDAAFVLSISVRSLDYLVAQKRLAFRKIGKRILFAHNELVKFAKADHLELTGRCA